MAKLRALCLARGDTETAALCELEIEDEDEASIDQAALGFVYQPRAQLVVGGSLWAQSIPIRFRIRNRVGHTSGLRSAGRKSHPSEKSWPAILRTADRTPRLFSQEKAAPLSPEPTE